MTPVEIHNEMIADEVCDEQCDTVEADENSSHQVDTTTAESRHQTKARHKSKDLENCDENAAVLGDRNAELLVDDKTHDRNAFRL